MHKIYVSPGNSGISLVDKVSLIKLNIKDNKVYIILWAIINYMNELIMLNFILHRK